MRFIRNQGAGLGIREERMVKGFCPSIAGFGRSLRPGQCILIDISLSGMSSVFLRATFVRSLALKRYWGLSSYHTKGFLVHLSSRTVKSSTLF